MKHDIFLDYIDNLDDFKALFLANLESEQTIYDCFISTVMIRITVNSLQGNQLVSIGFFDIETNHNTISKIQFDPTKDKRFGRAEPIHKIWLQDYHGAWGRLTFEKGQENEALYTICDLLYTIHKYQKLKAFI